MTYHDEGDFVDSYWLVTTTNPDGSTTHEASVGRSEMDAIALVHRERSPEASYRAERCPRFEWVIVEPVTVPAYEVDGREIISLKAHFFSGGTLGVHYKDLSFRIDPELPGKDLKVGRGGGRRTYIGKAHILCREHRDHVLTIDLEPLDDGHLVDRLTGEIIRFEAGIERSPALLPT